MAKPEEDDSVCNKSDNQTFESIVAARISRRGFLGVGAATAASATAVGTLLESVPDAKAQSNKKAPLLGFTGIPVSSADEVVVPPGYTASVLIAWGDPVSAGPAFKQDASNTAAEQALQFGMHNDGMYYFPIRGSENGLLVVNNEYADDVLLFTDGTADWTAEKTKKSQNAHGVSVIEVKREAGFGGFGNHWWWFGGGGQATGEWTVVRPSKYARRITASTPMRIGGPAAGDPRLQTTIDPMGMNVLGTLNNCAMGYTPWGTYLACEENFNGYFRKTGTQTQLETRYGVGPSTHPWATTDFRFNTNMEPNEPNRFGWVVEIDPFKPTSMPVKRTALGRMKHEGAWVQEARDGRIVVYMGDDQQNEYIYRFVSTLGWRYARSRGLSPLDDGTLYVAKFNENGSGQWLPLTPSNPLLGGLTLNDILINTRTAADRAGATKMDRPEWIDTFPRSLTAICTLTNNTARTAANVDAANPRATNNYGHIIRWQYQYDWTENTFYWDIFALGGDPAVTAHGSTIRGDKYGSPDGIYVSPAGRLWIQTDVSGSTINSGAYAGFGNNQMLCADPSTKLTRRFLTGPRVCEVTGVVVTPDEKTMFVGIQHPGEAPTGANDPDNPKAFSSWPDGAAGRRPRSATLVITKDDGGEIGS